MKAIGEAIASVGRALASRAVGTILGELSAEQIASLGAFVGQFAAPTAALGLLVIPSPNNGVSEEGTLPSAPNIGYKFDRPAGRLKLTALDDPDTFVIARLGRDMIFHDVVDNAPIARLLNDRIVFDKGVLEAAKLGNTGNDSDDDVSHAPSGSRDEPRICPRPGPDTPHGSSDAAKDYEDDVHARVNDSPLVTPREFAFKVFNPVQQKDVHIDDCFQTRGDNVDGDIEPGAFAEAKGPGLARQLKNNFMLELGTGLKLRTQAINQREAAGIRSIKWYVAEEAAAERIRETFAKHKITSITVSHMAPRQR